MVFAKGSSAVCVEYPEKKNIELLHFPPGKPAQNTYVERFQRTHREDVLNVYLFDDLRKVRTVTEH